MWCWQCGKEGGKEGVVRPGDRESEGWIRLWSYFHYFFILSLCLILSVTADDKRENDKIEM